MGLGRGHMEKGTKTLNPLAVRVGGKIRELRTALGLKQEALAIVVGYGSRSAIASIENGFVLPSLDKAVDIAHALGVEVADLVEDGPLEEGSLMAVRATTIHCARI